MNHKVINSFGEFMEAIADWSTPLVCDVETHPTRLLGIALAPLGGEGKIEAVYIPCNVYENDQWKQTLGEEFRIELVNLFSKNSFVGHNFVYDKQWIDDTFKVDSYWVADTRLMWHLSNNPAGPMPYGLKNAQVELLGMEAKGDVELEANVKAKGGSLKNGDHYLADLDVLAKYACLDAYSTAVLHNKLESFFIDNDYWWMMDKMMEYNILLQRNTKEGIVVDIEGLNKAHSRLLKLKESAKKRFYKENKDAITSLEHDWADRRIAGYKRQYNKDWLATHPEEWDRFNFNSDSHKRELFYDKLGYPVHNRTPSGKPAVDADSVKQFNSPNMGAYLIYEKANTLTTNFSGSYIAASAGDGKLHPGFNICGTVSYRLSGFKPYLLNAPFDEKIILKNFKCDPGYVGLHADLAAIEPTITAHYTEDKTLLKVFRDGLGDIYLDLALSLFPKDKELQDGYNGSIPITKACKQRFEKQRKIAKVVQLAVQYTGTGHTVAKNLTKGGIPTTVEEADGFVRLYWSKFRKVREWNYQLKVLNQRQGYLRNVIGRIIRVPDPEYKDLSNRFIQSSAHDVLVLWVLKIYAHCKEQGIKIKPILLDCHDSTSNQVPREYVEQLREIYTRSLKEVNEELELAVTIKAETKTFQSLAGLKGDET